MEKYKDIINLPNYRSKKRPPMSMHDRAAQFSPFAALTGHDDAIKETARLTDKRVELDETAKMLLNDNFNFILAQISEHPEITITYFIPDPHKGGGMYVDYTGNIKKYDPVGRKITFEDQTEISSDDIFYITSEILPQTDDYY